MKKLNLEYPHILKNFGNHLIPGRVESRAFLGWFLEHYYRLDGTDAQDAICDGSDDKGIDGIYVDHNLERIDVFQTKLYQKTTKTLGDTALKEFVGTLEQLRTGAAVEKLIAETGNTELKGLLQSADVPALVDGGYAIRGTFITNVPQTPAAISYADGRDDLTVIDATYLNENWVAPGDSIPIQAPARFRLDNLGVIQYETDEAEVFMAPLLAKDLVTLTGLESQELFAWNVRQTLGKTKVNKAIAESIGNEAEHKNFLLYHNGLTILAATAELDRDADYLEIDGYTVVNGCQSLSTLFEHRHKITDDLRILARIIKLSPQEDLASKITRHSNNQNSISARDLQSNSTIQRRLQQEFKDAFGDAVGYEIKRGESVEAHLVITNETAAKMLLAFDLEQPWACHQSYRLFDELHSEIFGRPEVSAHRITALNAVDDAVLSSMEDLENRLFAGYSLTRFFLMYLLKRALQVDEGGRAFVRDPRSVLEQVGSTGIIAICKSIVADLIVDLNVELKEREEAGTPLDHKRELKSPTAVRALSGQILPSYEKAIRRGRASSFEEEFASVKKLIETN